MPPIRSRVYDHRFEELGGGRLEAVYVAQDIPQVCVCWPGLGSLCRRAMEATDPPPRCVRPARKGVVPVFRHCGEYQLFGRTRAAHPDGVICIS